MKAKSGFGIKQVADSFVIVPMGERIVDFSAMITINDTGAFLWEKLQNDITVEELASQIVATALQDKYQGIINCCSGNPVSLGERAEQFIKENNLKIKLQYGAFPDRPYDSPGVWGDATVINKIMKG